MKRQLSAREIILLGILLVLLVVGGYWMLLYTPMKQELERLEAESVTYEEQIQVALAQAEDKRRMEQELAEIFAANPNPVGLAPYDNQKPVMFELNSILQSAEEYYLSFSTVDNGQEDGIVRRRIALSFTGSSYEKAREVLEELHSSAYRCMLDNLSVSLGEDGGRTTVDVTLVFFEYEQEDSAQNTAQSSIE